MNTKSFLVEFFYVYPQLISYNIQKIYTSFEACTYFIKKFERQTKPFLKFKNHDLTIGEVFRLETIEGYTLTI